MLDRIEETYKKLNQQKPFTIVFTDREFKNLSLEIITDTLKYIYQFNINEPRLTDTLVAYHFNAPEVVELIGRMQSVRCTWVNKLDYYVDEKKQYLVYMSIRPTALNLPFSRKKYYILTFYKQPQYYDAEGRLLYKKNRRRLRKINNEVFWRINDKVCYTFSSKFR